MPDGTPVDAAALAKQIHAFTKVIVDPPRPGPGEAMIVEVVPGFLPFMPFNLSGPVGAVNVVLNTAAELIKFTVKYEVVEAADPMATYQSVQFDSLTPGTLDDSDALRVRLRIVPPVAPEHGGPVTLELILRVTITVTVDGHEEKGAITYPLTIPAIPIPCLLVLTGNNKVFVMVRGGSQITDVQGAVSKINSAIQIVNDLKDVPGADATVGLFAQPLAMIAGMITGGGIAGLAVEEASVLNDYNDFDDEADQMALLGPTGTEVRFYSGDNFNETPVGGENEVSRRKLGDAQDLGQLPKVPVPNIGFGFLPDSGWQTTVSWDTDPGDIMDGVESCRYFDPGDPKNPGDNDLP